MKGYKTVIFNGVMAVLSVIALANPNAELPSGETIRENIEVLFAAYTAIVYIGNLILRAITDSPIFKGRGDA